MKSQAMVKQSGRGFASLAASFAVVVATIFGTSLAFIGTAGAAVNTPPAAPTWPATTATFTPATPEASSVILVWNNSAGTNASPATSYNVYMGTTAGGESTTPVNGALPIAQNGVAGGAVVPYTATQTEALIPGLTNGTTYYFTVVAINLTGNSVTSAEVSATPVSVPGAPTAVVITSGNSQVSLSWTAPTNTGASPIIGYNVYASSVAPTFDSVTGKALTGLSVDVATNAFLQQASPTCSAATGDAIPVNGRTCDALNNEVTSNLITGTSYTVTGLSNSSSYWFVVTAVNAIGESVPALAS